MPDRIEHGSSRAVIFYGLRFDCEANGCSEQHTFYDGPGEDSGEGSSEGSGDASVLPRGTTRPATKRVNGHAVEVVQQTVTYSAWTPATPVVAQSVELPPREWCTACRMAALPGYLDAIHLCAGAGQQGHAVCGCTREGCHVRKGQR